MKDFDEHVFHLGQFQQELAEFSELLVAKKELDERKVILPFFRSCRQLSAFFGSVVTEISAFDRLAYEFDIFGDFRCDLAVGDSQAHAYCFIEFEEAKRQSVFKKSKNKITPTWGAAFERGFSQIVDWLWKLDDQRQTKRFNRVFGSSEIQCIAILVVGRDCFVDDMERLRWRSSRSTVGHIKVYAYTYDQICQILFNKISYLLAMREET